MGTCRNRPGDQGRNGFDLESIGYADNAAGQGDHAGRKGVSLSLCDDVSNRYASNGSEPVTSRGRRFAVRSLAGIGAADIALLGRGSLASPSSTAESGGAAESGLPVIKGAKKKKKGQARAGRFSPDPGQRGFLGSRCFQRERAGQLSFPGSNRRWCQRQQYLLLSRILGTGGHKGLGCNRGVFTCQYSDGDGDLH